MVVGLVSGTGAVGLEVLARSAGVGPGAVLFCFADGEIAFVT
jgi:hypothetical protein